jgi:hypothetical protein
MFSSTSLGEQLHFDDMIMLSALHWTNNLVWGRHVAPLGHISCLQDNQSLLLLLNAACLAKKLQLPIFKLFSMLTITPAM